MPALTTPAETEERLTWVGSGESYRWAYVCCPASRIHHRTVRSRPILDIGCAPPGVLDGTRPDLSGQKFGGVNFGRRCVDQRRESADVLVVALSAAGNEEHGFARLYLQTLSTYKKVSY